MTSTFTEPPDGASSCEARAASALTPKELQLAAARGSLWTLVHVLVGIPVAFAANAVVARWLGVEEYGRLALITLVMGIAQMLTGFGVGEGTQQWGSAAYARGDQTMVDSLLRASLGFRLIVQVPLLASVVLVLAHAEPIWVSAVLMVAVVAPPLLGSSNLCISIENRTASGSKLALVMNLLAQATVAGLAIISRSPVAVWSGRYLVAALLQPVNFLILTPHRRRVALQARLPRGMPDGFWRFSLLTAVGGALAVLVASRSEIFVLEWLGEPRDVGIFALAFGIAIQLRGPAEAMMAPMLPGVAGIMEVYPELASRTLLRALRISGLFVAAILLGVPGLTMILPVIYGEEFSRSALLLPALALAALLQAMANPLLAFARAQRSGGLLLAFSGLSLIIDLIIAVTLIRPWGVWGAVLAAVSAQLVFVAFMAGLQVRRQLLAWKDFLRTCAPMVLATIALSGAVVSWLVVANLALTSVVYVAGIVAWAAGVRLILTEGDVRELEGVSNSLPRPVRVVVQGAIRILGGSGRVRNPCPLSDS